MFNKHSVSASVKHVVAEFLNIFVIGVLTLFIVEKALLEIFAVVMVAYIWYSSIILFTKT